jgi:hypothetical protein
MFFWQQKREVKLWISPISTGILVRQYNKIYFRVLTDVNETAKIFMSL